MKTSMIVVFLSLVALVIVLLFPSIIRRITLLLLGKGGRETVGRAALARQPDRITLTPNSTTPADAAQTVLTILGKAGFASAGSFTVGELGGLPIHFMVKPDNSVTAAVYEHPRAGVWYDLFTRYQDGTSYTLSNARLGGALEQRPGHRTVRLQGLDPAAMLARFLMDRPAGAMKAFTPGEVPAMFADAYAESIAWRKGRGISAEEVERAGMEEFKKR